MNKGIFFNHKWIIGVEASAVTQVCGYNTCLDCGQRHYFCVKPNMCSCEDGNITLNADCGVLVKTDTHGIMDKPQTVEDKVKHPNYYGGDTTYECIKVIYAWNLNFSLGSVLKYISRAGKKDKGATIEDLVKAKTYLEFEIAERKKNEQTNKD